MYYERKTWTMQPISWTGYLTIHYETSLQLTIETTIECVNVQRGFLEGTKCTCAAETTEKEISSIAESGSYSVKYNQNIF